MPKLKLFISFVLIFTFLFPLATSCYAEETSYVWSSSTSPSVPTSSTNQKQETTTTPESNSNSLQLESPSAILIEQTTGQVLYEHNSHEPLHPASVTKVMSLLLIMEALDAGSISLTDSIPCSENAASMGG